MTKSHLTALEFLILIVGIPCAIWAIMWSYNGVQAHTAPDSILGISRISATKIDGILCKAKSPSCQTDMGQDIVNRAYRYRDSRDYPCAPPYQLGRVDCPWQLPASRLCCMETTHLI